MVEGARSPQEAELQRGLLRVAQVASENGEALALLTDQLALLDWRLQQVEQLRHEVVFGGRRAADLENRLSAMERRAGEPAIPAARTDELDARLSALEQRGSEAATPDPRTDELDARLSALEHRDEAGRAVTGDRMGALDERIARAEQVRHESVGATSERLTALDERLADLHELGRDAAAVADVRLGALDGRLRSLEELGRRAAATTERLGALAERVTRLEPLSVDIGNMAADLSRRLTELRSVEERVTLLEAGRLATAERPERPIRAGQARVEGRSRDVAAGAEALLSPPSHVTDELTDVGEPVQPEPRRVEEGPEAVESADADAEAEVERLCRSLYRLVGENTDGAPGPAAGNSDGHGAGAVEALSAELHQIRRSLESLPRETTPEPLSELA